MPENIEPERPDKTDFDCTKLVFLYDQHGQHVQYWRIWDDLDQKFVYFPLKPPDEVKDKNGYRPALDYLGKLRERRKRLYDWFELNGLVELKF